MVLDWRKKLHPEMVKSMRTVNYDAYAKYAFWCAHFKYAAASTLLLTHYFIHFNFRINIKIFSKRYTYYASYFRFRIKLISAREYWQSGFSAYLCEL